MQKLLKAPVLPGFLLRFEFSTALFRGSEISSTSLLSGEFRDDQQGAQEAFFHVLLAYIEHNWVVSYLSLVLIGKCKV